MHGIRRGHATRRRARSTVLTVLTALTLVLPTAATSGRAAEPPATAKAAPAAESPAPGAKSNRTSAFAADSGEECTATAPGSRSAAPVPSSPV